MSRNQERRDPDRNPCDDERERSPSLGPAIVSGGCAVAVALITGLFNWVSRPSGSPPAPTPPLAVAVPDAGVRPVRTAALETNASTVPVRPKAQEPLYGLNFQAFQAVVRDTSLEEEVRERVVARVVGHVVMWQGYVVRHVVNNPEETGFVGTVVLVEDPQLVHQTLQPRAALCRFAKDDADQLKNLKPGQRVTISGDCHTHNAIGTEVLNCHLVDAFYDEPR